MITSRRSKRSTRLRFERLVIIALGLAGLVDGAMLAVAAKLFHTPHCRAWTASRRPTRSSATWSAAPPRSRFAESRVHLARVLERWDVRARS